MSGKTERVQVKMTPEFKAVLKSYAETYGMTLDMVLYRCTNLMLPQTGELSAISWKA